MSRVGKQPISIPQGVEVEQKGDVVIVKGQKGQLEEKIHPDMKIVIKDGVLTVERPDDNRFNRALHGLTRSLIYNMVVGLTEGFQKALEIVGVGYRAELKGRSLVLLLGYSHPIYFVPPEDITIEVPAPTKIIVKGVSKQLVGQVAAKIRSFRPPEPYKGKGVRYEGEHVRRKAGKVNV
ncbi:50S ribosomal protein L6 [candidate division KSB1 bacterium]|nr:MAG: 50S ribosomal protein L6 [candidate division KSB1 bacterium]